MIISARFSSTCPVCGSYIDVGDKIEWSRGARACHEACANGPVRAASRAPAPKASSTEPAPWRLSGGSGNGCTGWVNGQTLRCSDRLRAQGYPMYITVARASRCYIREDGMSFGVGDESGYSYSAECREATESEIAPVREREEKAEVKRSAQKRIEEIGYLVQTSGEHVTNPDGSQIQLSGERLHDSQTIYGGGFWFVVAPDGLWYVRNNGSDGDDWSYNNVATGGAGAVGWRLVEGAPALIAELRQLVIVLLTAK